MFSAIMVDEPTKELDHWMLNFSYGLEIIVPMCLSLTYALEKLIKK